MVTKKDKPAKPAKPAKLAKPAKPAKAKVRKEKKRESEITQEDLEVLVVCAMRYSLGRGSYIVSIISDVCESLQLSKATKDLIISEIKEHLRSPHLCDWNDDRWRALLNTLESSQLASQTNTPSSKRSSRSKATGESVKRKSK
jgi:hypothetical protein